MPPKAKGKEAKKKPKGAKPPNLSDEQWAALRSAWGGCAYCGAGDRPLQKDCVRALSRGGRYTLDNIVPACGSCNASKCNDEVTSWLRRKRLDERAFLLDVEQLVDVVGHGSCSSRAGSIPGNGGGAMAGLGRAEPPCALPFPGRNIS